MEDGLWIFILGSSLQLKVSEPKDLLLHAHVRVHVRVEGTPRGRVAACL